MTSRNRLYYLRKHFGRNAPARWLALFLPYYVFRYLLKSWNPQAFRASIEGTLAYPSMKARRDFPEIVRPDSGMVMLRHIAPLAANSRGKESFLRSLPAGARVLDVGCGNNSPARAKKVAPGHPLHGPRHRGLQPARQLHSGGQTNTSSRRPREFAARNRSARGEDSTPSSPLTISSAATSRNGCSRAFVAALRPGGLPLSLVSQRGQHDLSSPPPQYPAQLLR